MCTTHDGFSVMIKDAMAIEIDAADRYSGKRLQRRLDNVLEFQGEPLKKFLTLYGSSKGMLKDTWSCNVFKQVLWQVSFMVERIMIKEVSNHGCVGSFFDLKSNEAIIMIIIIDGIPTVIVIGVLIIVVIVIAIVIASPSSPPRPHCCSRRHHRPRSRGPRPRRPLRCRRSRRPRHGDARMRGSWGWDHGNANPLMG